MSDSSGRSGFVPSGQEPGPESAPATPASAPVPVSDHAPVSDPDPDSVPVSPSVRDRLAAERAGTEERIAALSRDFETIVEANTLVAVDDEHDPDGSSTAFERAHVASLLAQAREHLVELDQAWERLERDDYGRCEHCGAPIPPERLEVRPATTTCVSCAEAGA